MSDYPFNYELQNNASTKQLNVVVKIEGSETQFSLVKTYKKIRYGEDGILYGDPGLVYGGLIPIAGVKAILSINSNLIISQKIEPEQGRGSAGTFSLEFVDLDGFMTEFVTPGKELNEILGGKLVKIYLGYQNTSYPEDYFVVFRGYISSVTSIATKVILQLTDANLKRRQQCFYLGKGTVYGQTKTFTTGDVDPGTDTFTVTGHGYTVDTKVTFGSSTALPGGLDFGTDYFIKNPTANTFQLSNYWDGPVLDITSSGVGNLQVRATKISGTVGYNFTPNDVNTALDKITIVNHGFINNRILTFKANGVLPSGLTIGVQYYALVLTPDEFQVSLTPSGIPVDLSTPGIGQQQVFIANAPENQTKIPMAKTDGFSQPILGPDGVTYDASARNYLKIKDEFLEYGAGDVFSDGIVATRGARGTAVADIEIDSDVDNYVELEGNPIDLSLKVMLSGWAGPCFSGIAVYGFNLTGLTNPIRLPNAFILPDRVNAVEDYGMAVGDYLTVTGSASNDGLYTIRAFGDLSEYPNKVVFVNETVTDEWPTSGVFSLRSQYDTLPKACGTKLKTYDVDVARWKTTRIDYLFQADNNMRILQSQPIASKELIEKEFLLPCGAYSVTRFGRLSVTITKPPIIDGRSVYLDASRIVEPQNISVTRSLNSRSFFNEVQYQYNVDDAGSFTDTKSVLDSDSLFNFDTSSVLPIQSRGLHSDLGAENFISRRGLFLLRRYKDAAILIKCKTNWEASSMIEVGDVVPLYDNGTLHVANFQDGSRDLGSQLFEVWERSLDMKTGTANLTLASQLGYQIDDRFATISPSTLVDAGSTADRVRIKDSFGGLYPGNEKRKWEGFEGEQVRFHSYDFTYDVMKTFIGFDPSDPTIMIVDPPFGTPPVAGTIIDIADYSEVSAADGQKYKVAFAFIDPTVAVVSGTSTTVFDVSAPDALKFSVGLSVLVRDAGWNTISRESKVVSIVGTTITVDAAFAFTPAAGQFVELIGFVDGSGPYRLI